MSELTQQQLLADLAGADLSDCGLYRWSLWRTWGIEAPFHFVGFNPSTADANEDDPTIRRMIGFAKREGAGGIVVTNLYAMRSTERLSGSQLTGGIRARVENSPREQIRRSPAGARVIVCWGALRNMDELREAWTFTTGWHAQDLEKRALWCLGQTAKGHPKHPLYLRADTPLEIWSHPEYLPRLPRCFYS